MNTTKQEYTNKFAVVATNSTQDKEANQYKLQRIYIYIYILKLTPWLMEPGGSMPHSQGLSNNSYPEPNQPNYPH